MQKIGKFIFLFFFKPPKNDWTNSKLDFEVRSGWCRHDALNVKPGATVTIAGVYTGGGGGGGATYIPQCAA